ncbi:MAG: NAD(P)-binding domain-containing protein [Clostridia bacterium]|nr:NAD(P)-binding domain-containing protein [Clostridia bacterium]
MTGFLGTGNMGGAIINGMLSSGILKPSCITVYDADPKASERFLKLGCCIARNEATLAELCDIIFLCIKPQVFPDIKQEQVDRRPVQACSPVTAGKIIFNIHILSRNRQAVEDQIAKGFINI